MRLQLYFHSIYTDTIGTLYIHKLIFFFYFVVQPLRSIPQFNIFVERTIFAIFSSSVVCSVVHLAVCVCVFDKLIKKATNKIQNHRWWLQLRSVRTFMFKSGESIL